MSPPERLAVLGVGARTPIGLDAPASAAARRAAISGVCEHPWFVDGVGDPIVGALDSLLDPRWLGAARLLALAEPALQEASRPLALAGGPAARIPVYLGLPEFRPGFTERDAAAVSEGVRDLDSPVDIGDVHCYAHGHASGWMALAAAAARLRAGDVTHCLVGGVDSYFHPQTLEWLDEHRQLQGQVSRSAFVPGEAAGFLLVAGAAGVHSGLPVLATVTEPALARETKLIKTAEVCVGTGLTQAVLQCLQSLGPLPAPIDQVICDINGERYRAEEWGFASLRASQHFADASAYWAPADCWGDVGAASAPLFAMLACQAAWRGYAEGPLAMAWASSEGGLRAAAILELPVRR